MKKLVAAYIIPRAEKWNKIYLLRSIWLLFVLAERWFHSAPNLLFYDCSLSLSLSLSLNQNVNMYMVCIRDVPISEYIVNLNSRVHNSWHSSSSISNE